MRKLGGFLLNFCINAVLNLSWTLPAWLLLGLHFWKGWSLSLFFGALGLWLLAVFLKTLVFRLLARGAASPERQAVNKNPYSSKTREIFHQKKP